MRKLILSMFTSLDGYIEGPGGEFVPPPWSDEVEKNWSGWAMEHGGHLLYGRVNFEGMKAFWGAADTDPASMAAGIWYAGQMNRFPKTVVSRTLTGDPGWNGQVAGPDLAAEVARLKAGEGKDVLCFGGAKLVHTLMKLDAFDEYRLMVAPFLLGDGVRLFQPGFERLELQLLEAKTLDVGSVILHYARVR